MWTLIAGVIGKGLSMFLDYFNASARLARKEKQDAVDEARQAVEAERLQSTYHRIEAEAPRPPADLLERLRRSAK